MFLFSFMINENLLSKKLAKIALLIISQKIKIFVVNKTITMHFP